MAFHAIKSCNWTSPQKQKPCNPPPKGKHGKWADGRKGVLETLVWTNCIHTWKNFRLQILVKWRNNRDQKISIRMHQSFPDAFDNVKEFQINEEQKLSHPKCQWSFFEHFIIWKIISKNLAKCNIFSTQKIVFKNSIEIFFKSFSENNFQNVFPIFLEMFKEPPRSSHGAAVNSTWSRCAQLLESVQAYGLFRNGLGSIRIWSRHGPKTA